MDEITATVLALPKNLFTAEQAARDLQRYAISAETLTQFADTGFAPHWRVNGGPPLFIVRELKEWLAANVTTVCQGRALPRTFSFTFRPAPLSSGDDLPEQLRGVNCLCDITQSVSLSSGVYFLIHEGEVVYVGQSVSPAYRVREHFHDKIFDRVLFLPTVPEELNGVEGTFIRHLKPKYNINRHGRVVGPNPGAEVAESILAKHGVYAEPAASAQASPNGRG
jgi:hypothetical protein